MGFATPSVWHFLHLFDESLAKTYHQVMEFFILVEDNKIILDSMLEEVAIEALYGRYADIDLLSLLEAEHQQEIELVAEECA